MRQVRVLLLLAVLSLGTLSAASLLHAAPGTTSGKYFDYSVTILMENNDLPSVLSEGTYQASLANQYTLSTGYSGVSHPSEPNYSVLIGGHISPNRDDGICCGQDTSLNLVDRLESKQLTWNAFAEGLTNGDCSGSGIDTDHMPFLFFSDIVNNPTRCGNLRAATSGSDTQLIAALNANSGWPNYIWLTPNTSNDAHDTSIAFGDRYLAALVPQILASNLFQTQRAGLFIVYDEGNDVQCTTGGSDCIYASWSGPVAKRGFTSSNPYDHYSYLHTIEDNWALPPLTNADAVAPVMSEFFTSASSVPTPLSTSFTTSPTSVQAGQTVTFTSSPTGGTAPYSEVWEFGDGSTGSGASTAHVYSSPGTFQVRLTATDSASPAATVSLNKTLIINPAPIQGTFSLSISSNPINPTVGQLTSFTATLTGGNSPYGVGWDFGDGAIAVGLIATHTYTRAGTYNVTAAVTDSSSPAHTKVTSIFITVGPVSGPPPALSAQFLFNPSNPTVGTSVSFSSTVSGGTSPYDYAWGFGDSSGSDTAHNPSYTYTTSGTFTVTLSITDAVGDSVTVSHDVTVSPTSTPPTALSAQFSFSPSSPTVGTSVSFSSTVSGGTMPYSYAWDFGDSIGSDTVANPTYTFTTSGRFTVTLTVTDSLGDSATVSHRITVSPTTSTPPPSSGTSGQYCTSLTQGSNGDLEPIVSVDYVNPSNSADYRPNALFDTGTSYSLAPSTLATSLGLTMADGIPISLTSASGTPIQAYLFHLTLNMGGTLHVENVPVAMTDSTNQFLIGRIGFLTQVSVTIEPSGQTICFTASGLPNDSGTTCKAGELDGDGDYDGDHCGEIGATDHGDGDDASSSSVDFVGIVNGASGGAISGLGLLFTAVPLIGLAFVAATTIVTMPLKKKRTTIVLYRRRIG